MRLYHSDKTGLYCNWFDDMNLLAFGATIDGKELFNKAFNTEHCVIEYLKENGYVPVRKENINA